MIVRNIYIYAGVGFLLWLIIKGSPFLSDDRATPEYTDLILKAKKNYPFISMVPSGLVQAIITHESGGDPTSIGQIGTTREVGLMQITPPNWPWLVKKFNLGFYDESIDWFDPYKNIIVGMHLLAHYYKLITGYSWHDAIVAYNAGSGNWLSGRIQESTRVYYDRVNRTWSTHSDYILGAPVFGGVRQQNMPSLF